MKKLTKKARKAIEERRAQAIGMLEFAATLIRKAEAEHGKDSEAYRSAIRYDETVNSEIGECNRELGED